MRCSAEGIVVAAATMRVRSRLQKISSRLTYAGERSEDDKSNLIIDKSGADGDDAHRSESSDEYVL
jgi:hypothetical protein